MCTIHDIRNASLDAVAAPGLLERFRPEARDLFNSASHGLSALAAVFGALALLLVAPDATGWRLVVVIYGLGTMAMFGASGLYHAQKREEAGTGIWRRIDHSAVFLMIAGTYTPVAYAYLPTVWFWWVIGAQWILAFGGIAFKLTSVGKRRWLTVGVYLAMGWMAVIPAHKLFTAMSASQFLLLSGGGLAYTGGAIIYALKRPDPWSERIGFHGIWHVAIILAAVMHYAVIFRVAGGTP